MKNIGALSVSKKITPKVPREIPARGELLSHGDSHGENHCPDCGIRLVRLGHCFTCPLCGWGGCN